MHTQTPVSPTTARALRFGLLLILATQAVPFVVFISVKYLFDGTAKPPTLNPYVGAIETALMVLSGLYAWQGVTAIRADRLRTLLGKFDMAILLGWAAVATTGYQWSTRFVPPTTRFGEVYYLLTGLSGFYAVIGLFVLMAIRIRGRRLGFSAANHWDAEAITYFWVFQTLTWFSTYVALYWI